MTGILTDEQVSGLEKQFKDWPQLWGVFETLRYYQEMHKTWRELAVKSQQEKACLQEENARLQSCINADDVFFLSLKDMQQENVRLREVLGTVKKYTDKSHICYYETKTDMADDVNYIATQALATE